MKRICLGLSLLNLSATLLGTTFTVTNTADSGAGSLRQAILDANANPGVDTIAFNVVGSGIQTIQPVTPLPSTTEAVTIDGYTQPGASANTNPPDQGSNAVILIEVDGQNLAAGQNGFTVLSPSTIRGLAINRGANSAIAVGAEGDGAVIAGNFLGTDPTGSSLPGPQAYGVLIAGASGVVVGGTAPADRNVISGHSAANVQMGDAPAPNTIVKGNLIGLNAAGTAALSAGNPYAGIYVRVGTAQVIGGPSPAERNVISGLPVYGVAIGSGLGGPAVDGTIEGNYIGTDVTGTLPIPNYVGIIVQHPNSFVRSNVVAGSTYLGITGFGTDLVIQGNFIGTDGTATLDLGNGEGGILVNGNNWTIGGTGAGEGNVIAHNGTPYGGIFNTGSQMARIRGNRIFENAALGINLGNLGGSGVTPNDVGDGDTGANGLQNYPLLISAGPAIPQGTSTHITGILNSKSTTTFDIDFYSNPACASRPQEYLEGQDYLGSTQVTTDGSGNASFDVTLPAVVEPGARITATATDPSGNTSEFSQRLIFSVSPNSGPPQGGTGVTISGMLFDVGAAVTVGGVAAANVNVANPTQITATTPVLPAGSLNSIVVTNPNGTGGTLVNGWVADFSDVPHGQLFYNRIIKLVANAITVGCGTGIYCPLNSVTRQQMAVFLLKSKNGLCYVPPPCTGVFPDVPCSSNFAPWIEALAAAGITGGCGGGNYCPTNPVIRQQMAVFLLKTKHGSSFVPPPCDGDFGDVACPGNPFADWIEELAEEGITGGCGGGNYCPTQSVRRDQMAAFLGNTFQF